MKYMLIHYDYILVRLVWPNTEELLSWPFMCDAKPDSLSACQSWAKAWQTECTLSPHNEAESKPGPKVCFRCSDWCNGIGWTTIEHGRKCMKICIGKLTGKAFWILGKLRWWSNRAWWGYPHAPIKDARAVMAIFFANTNLCFFPNIDIPPPPIPPGPRSHNGRRVC